MATKQDEIRQLEEVIVRNSEAYYSGQNCIPDAVFDHYVQRLAELDPDNAILKTTGWGMKVEDAKKQPHKYGEVIGIPDKIRPEDVKKRIRNWGLTGRKGYSTPKLDGASVLLYYAAGRLEDALTRGDGEFGERILNKMKGMVPNHINPAFTGRIRGEFVITKERWNEKYADRKSARNFGAGLLNRDTDWEEDIKNFDLVCYTVLDINRDLSYDEQLHFLMENGFRYVKTNFGTFDDSLTDIAACEAALNALNGGVYECDGLVINLGEKQFAVKWNTEGVETTVTDIKWQSSRLGKLSPVVYINPVELSGATIQKTSGFNYEYIKETGLGVGSTIKIIRSGDVIPYITEVVSTSKDQRIPENCPVCGTKLEVEGVHIVCKNMDCASRGEGTLLHFINEVTPVDGLGEKMLQKLFEGFRITNIKKFITFANSYDSFHLLRFCTSTNGLGRAAFNKFTELLNKYKNETLNLDKIFIGLGLPALGERAATRILDTYDYEVLMDKLRNQTISGIPGVNYVVIQSLYTYYEYIDDIVKSFRNIPLRTLKKASGNGIMYTGMKVCITGALSVSRKAFLDECKAVGIEESSISKATVLVTNDTTSGSTKNREAEKRGIRVMSEAEFRKEYLG